VDQKLAMLERLRERNAGAKFRRFGERYYSDIPGFMRDCIRWEGGRKWASYQTDIASTLFEHRRMAVRSNRRTGKSATAAGIILGFALTREAMGINWRIVTTASIWRQLTLYLWPEVHKQAKLIDWDKVGRPSFKDGDELQNMSLVLPHGRADAVASKEGATIEGGQADTLLLVCDEAKIIPRSIWDSARGMMAGGLNYWLAVSTPGEESGVFYDIFRRSHDWANWQTRHVTVGEAVTAGQVSADWVREMEESYGEDDPFYRQQVLGEFANYADAGGIVPLVWVEKANQRWEAWDAAGRPGRVTGIGFDVGGGLASGDQSVIAVIHDYNKVGEIVEIRAASDPSMATMELVGKVVGLANSLGRPPIYGDAQGIGSGVVGRLLEMGYEAYPFVASYGTTLLDAPGVYGFVNWRAAAWWLMREALDPDSGQELALPPHDGLTGDLTAPRLKRIDSNARRQVEAKEDLRKRLGRSPDVADAVLHGMIGPVLWAERQQGEQVVYRVKESGYRIGNY